MKAGKIRPILSDYAYTSNIDWEELHELERLAEIGQAVEWAFKSDVIYSLLILNDDYRADVAYYNVNELVEAYRKEQCD